MTATTVQIIQEHHEDIDLIGILQLSHRIHHRINAPVERHPLGNGAVGGVSTPTDEIVQLSITNQIQASNGELRLKQINEARVGRGNSR